MPLYNGRFGDDPVFTSSPDVTYSFSKAQTSYAIVSLDFPETDTRVYIMEDHRANGGGLESAGEPKSRQLTAMQFSPGRHSLLAITLSSLRVNLILTVGTLR